MKRQDITPTILRSVVGLSVIGLLGCSHEVERYDLVVQGGELVPGARPGQAIRAP